MRASSRFAVAIALAGALVAACSGAASPTPAPSPSPAASVAASPEASPSPAPSPSPSPTPDACAPANLKLVTAGKLTVGTDNPAYPPYFAPRDGGNTPPWQGDFVGDPTDGQGFESAVAYAVAAKLGFPADQVAWIPVKFDNSYAPGPKPFDFYLAQVSYKPERAQTADLSAGYYFVNQSVVALRTSPLAKVTTISGLAGYKFGAQAGTTSYDTIKNTIKPTAAISVYDSNDAAITALKNKQIDGIVVDLPTAFFATAVQIVDKSGNGLANIVGQFPAPTSADAEHYSLVLAKGSPLTACVNLALAAIKADGTLEQITKTWLSEKASAPVFQP
jgi:polar amino acid transport system substrate-binding protein